MPHQSHHWTVTITPFCFAPFISLSIKFENKNGNKNIIVC
jgi:hypothetical protein